MNAHTSLGSLSAPIPAIARIGLVGGYGDPQRLLRDGLGVVVSNASESRRSDVHEAALQPEAPAQLNS